MSCLFLSNRERCQELFDIYAYQAKEAFTACLRKNLVMLENRLLPNKDSQKSKNDNFSIVKLQLLLNLPNIKLKPSLEDFQLTINDIVYEITRMLPSMIIQWGETRQMTVYAERELVQHENLFRDFIKSQPVSFFCKN